MRAVVFLALIGAVVCRTLDEQWHSWKSSHGKVYADTAEEMARRKIWLDNSARIEEYNRGNNSFSMALNHFADMSPEEFKDAYLSPVNMEVDSDAEVGSFPMDLAISDSLDWRKKGVVTEVCHQGKCRDSWAFSAIGALEGQVAKRSGEAKRLSVQQLLDCSWKFGTNGCNSGSPTAAFKYIQYNGICLSSAYSYLGYTWKCMCQYCRSVVGINKYECLAGNSESELKKAVYNIGPISVSVDATSYEFQFYSGGLYTDNSCSSSKLNHAMLVVGYGTSNGQDYWIAKNSWGIPWGEGGYIRMARNRNNMCGIATAPCYPYARLFS